MSDSSNKSSRPENIESWGSLYVVSTPIGNLGDITYRAVEILKNVHIIAAEDTRRASILTRRYEIDTPRLSFHDYNAKKRVPELIKRIQRGNNVALISDAGTPGISDPGYVLIRNCIDSGIPIIQAPGPAALISALVISGLPTGRFVFEGFLPVKKGRRKKLEELAGEKRTIILYESPHRLLRTFRDLLDVLGDREIAVVREITKLYEEVIRARLTEVIDCFENRKPKGEFVLVVRGA